MRVTYPRGGTSIELSSARLEAPAPIALASLPESAQPKKRAAKKPTDAAAENPVAAAPAEAPAGKRKAGKKA